MRDHKLYELTVNENGIRFRHANPNPLSAEQKYNLVMVAIVCTTVISFILAIVSPLR